MDPLVITEQHDHVVVVRLNRPKKLNAITPALVEQLCQALERAHADDSLGAIVLAGAGSSFCAGDDLHDSTAHTAAPSAQQDFVERLQDVTRLLMFGRLPVVAAVRGWAVGGGLEWVFNADFVVAGETARGFFPEMSLGLFPSGDITSILPSTLGAARARQLLMLGERIDAMQLLDWGVACSVVADDEVEQHAMVLATTLAGLPTRSIRALRSALQDLTRDDIDQALMRETSATIEAFVDPETPARLARLAP